MTLDDILLFKNWVISNKCEAVALESTGVYWIPIYTVLEGLITVILHYELAASRPGSFLFVVYYVVYYDMCQVAGKL